MIFARPRHTYDSYSDFWTLVRLCGYPVVWQDEIDTTLDTTYIFTGPDARLEFPEGKARIIYWLLEWYGDYYQRPGVAETWVSNKTFAEQVGARYVPLGSHEDLGQVSPLDNEYDIIHLSYADINRRRSLLDNLIRAGVTLAPNGWGEARDQALRKSRAMLHIHQHGDMPGIAPLRVAIGAAYGLPVICENGWSTEPYDDAIFSAPYDKLQDTVQTVLKSGPIMVEKAMALHERLCHDMRFDKVVEAHV